MASNHPDSRGLASRAHYFLSDILRDSAKRRGVYREFKQTVATRPPMGSISISSFVSRASKNIAEPLQVTSADSLSKN
jgi:hypothetical protein